MKTTVDSCDLCGNTVKTADFTLLSNVLTRDNPIKTGGKNTVRLNLDLCENCQVMIAEQIMLGIRLCNRSEGHRL